jgi:hypothetical protein
VVASLRTKETSIILDKPAAIRVYPNTVWTIVLSGRCWGCADIAQPVIRITKPGMKFLFGPPSRFLLSQIPARPAHHQMTPIVVCWISFPTQAPPQLCSVKVLTQPHAAIRRESKNSCDRPVLFSQACPTSMMIVRIMPYPIKALPMMKWARHCPRWSSRQYPRQ